MKIKSTLFIIGVLLIFKCGISQNNILKIDTSFNIVSSTSVDPYNLVILEGVSKKNVKKIIITVKNGSQKTETYEIKQFDNKQSWKTSIGSFLPKQIIELEFNVYTTPDSILFDNVRKTTMFILSDALNTALEKYEGNYTIENFNSFIRESCINQLPEELLNYYNLKNQNAAEYIISAITSNLELMRNVLSLQKSINNRNKIIDSLRKDTNFIKAINNPDLRSLTTDSLKKLKNNINDINYSKNLNSLIISLKDIDQSKKECTELLNPDSLFNISTFTTSNISTTAFTSDIKNYIGLDVSSSFFMKQGMGTFGLFLMASPYFGKTDPEEKIFNPNSTCSSIFRKFISPTIGICLTSSSASDTLKPMIFLGGSFRINQIVRVTVGLTFSSKFELSKGLGTFGIGIDLNYVAELLRITTTSLSTFKF